jgi:hypothetical protein
MLRSSYSLSALCAFLAVTAIAAPATATILTFNIDNFPAGTSASTATLLAPPHSVYGDNVSSAATTIGAFTYNYGIGNGFTPNTTVAYTLGTNAINQLYYTDVGDPPSPLWTNVDFLHGGTNPFTHYITFVPTGQFGVRVNSFDVFGYSTATAHTYSWNLREDTTVGTIFASGGPTAFVGTIAAPSSVTTGSDYYFGTVVLEIIHTAGVGGGWGMDNLNFDEALPPVPEPSTALLLGLGMLGMAFRVRRSRRLSEGQAS